ATAPRFSCRPLSKVTGPLPTFFTKLSDASVPALVGPPRVVIPTLFIRPVIAIRPMPFIRPTLFFRRTILAGPRLFFRPELLVLPTLVPPRTVAPEPAPAGAERDHHRGADPPRPARGRGLRRTRGAADAMVAGGCGDRGCGRR